MTRKKWLQFAILAAAILLGGFTIAGSMFKDDKPPKAGDAAPDFKLVGMDGQTHKLSDYRGKPVVVNFWGTFCKPCRDEMPALQRQADKHKTDGVEVLGVNVESNTVGVKSFVEQLGVHFPILYDDNEKTRRGYGVTNYPATFFIDKDGKVRAVSIGQMDEAFIDGALSDLKR